VNTLWHIDGNEKLCPWEFWVHGCVNGYSWLIIYLGYHSNKQAVTIAQLFTDAVGVFGWPSRGQGDFGLQNNKVE
jgi:hypothetical protein